MPPFPSHELFLPSGAPFQFRRGRARKGTKEIFFPQRGSEPLASLKRHLLTQIHSPPHCLGHVVLQLETGE